ncbi:hypothetical protein Taro_036432, partial [Colocasia esculenta]|nr:hypothetical protein [Colocasia esculenta]
MNVNFLCSLRRYGVWSMIGLQFWEKQPWEGFVDGIRFSYWSFLCVSSCSSRLGSVNTFSSYSSR